MLTSAPCALCVQEDGRELWQAETPLFACAAYHEDMHYYVAEQVPPHWHPELEVLVMEQGSARVLLGNEEVLLFAGDGYFTNEGALHGLRCGESGPCVYRSLVFDASIVAGAAGSVFDTLYLRPLIESGPRTLVLRGGVPWQNQLLCLVDEAVTASAEGETGYEFTVRALLSRIVLLLLRHTGEQPAVRPAALREARMKDMLAWIEKNYGSAVTLGDIAAAANICARECERTFDQLMHVSPMTHLLRRRAAKAAALLADTELPVTEVGLRCGFASPSYFARQFGGVMGCTPRAYRSRVRAGQAQP